MSTEKDSFNGNNLPKKTIATVLAAATGFVALSMAGCSRPSYEGYISCTGSTAYEVKPGENLAEILLKEDLVQTLGEANDTAVQLSHLTTFKGEGPIPDFMVYRTSPGSRAAGVTAGAIVDVPRDCERVVPKASSTS